jgi:hypothetical protein
VATGGCQQRSCRHEIGVNAGTEPPRRDVNTGPEWPVRCQRPRRDGSGIFRCILVRRPVLARSLANSGLRNSWTSSSQGRSGFRRFSRYSPILGPMGSGSWIAFARSSSIVDAQGDYFHRQERAGLNFVVLEIFDLVRLENVMNASACCPSNAATLYSVGIDFRP